MRPVLLDGALGTELEAHGVSCKLPLWTTEALLNAPEQIVAIHRAYVEAGAHVLTAGTFRTSRYTLSKANMGDRAAELTKLAVELAREAARIPAGSGDPARENTFPISPVNGGESEARASAQQGPASTLVAGSIAPLEDCFHPELAPGDLVLRAEHRHNAQTLAEAGVDIILVETQNSIREAQIATHYARATGIPVWTSFIMKSDTELLNGDSLREAARTVVKFGAAAVLINCTPLPIAAQAMMNLSMHVPQGIAIGVYPNALDQSISPADFADWGARVKAIADIIGGCCGIGPEHIHALHKSISHQK
ncbi:MAG: homocysteine S-methyltransferase family protein [Calditrichaeota bacterium]|nr:homocysteine S-methyltransferase family protein [Calditrichota bacterium]